MWHLRKDHICQNMLCKQNVEYDLLNNMFCLAACCRNAHLVQVKLTYPATTSDTIIQYMPNWYKQNWEQDDAPVDDVTPGRKDIGISN